MHVIVPELDLRVEGDADFEMEILSDAALMAAVYWKNHLWKHEHEVYRPSRTLYERFSGRYGVGGIDEIWSGWFATLTSDDYFIVLAGVDIESVGDGYGLSARRS